MLWSGKHHAMAFCRIPPGRFRMGSRGYEGFLNKSDEEPRHMVELTGCWPGEKPLTEPQAFYLGETPVTRAQYAALVGLTGVEPESAPAPERGEEKHPVADVSWRECRQVITGLNGLSGLESLLVAAGLPQHYRFRFPTEAEWEYACRAGTETEYYTGDGEAALGEAGWYAGNSGGSTHPVGKNGDKQPNAWGLSDLHGNVLEWCLDGYDQDAYTKRGAMKKDPFVRTETDGSHRVSRGGSWDSSPRVLPFGDPPQGPSGQSLRASGLPPMLVLRSGGRSPGLRGGAGVGSGRERSGRPGDQSGRSRGCGCFGGTEAAAKRAKKNLRITCPTISSSIHCPVAMT